MNKRSASTGSALVDVLRLSTLLMLALLCLGTAGAWANEDEWWLQPALEEPSPPTPLPLAGEGSMQTQGTRPGQASTPLPLAGEGSMQTQGTRPGQASAPLPQAGEMSESFALESANGRKVEVVLLGLPEYLQADVLASLTVQRQRNSPFLDDLLVGNLAQRAEREAAEAMEASGFYRAKVEAGLQITETGWRLSLHFTPGPIVRITEVEVQLLGGALAQQRVVDFGKTFPLMVNAPLVHPPYETFKRQWLQLAQDMGFLDAAYTRHEIVVNPDNDTAQVFLTLESGTRYAFGRTRFDQAGPMIFDLALLDGFVPWKEGEPYLVSRLLELQRTLSDSQYFERMEVAPIPNKQTHTVDVGVNLSTRKQTRYAFGIGYGTDTGARVSAEMERRFLNARGDRFHGKVNVSERDALGDLELRRPWIKPFSGTERLFGLEGLEIGGKPSTDFFSVALRSRLEKLDDVDTKTVALRLAANDTKGAWRRQARLTMLYEEDEIHKQPNLYGHMLLPGLNVSYRPQVRSRTESLAWDVDAQASFGALLSSTSLAQIRGNALWTLPVRAHDQVLLRASLGTSWSADFDKVPISLRYFAGGDQSVRGYAFKSLGARDAAGNVLGGEHLLALSAEYQWMFKNPFGMAVFVDTGNAFNGTDIALKTGAGLGALWRSPVGMLGLYLAHGFENKDEVVRLHFSLGAEF